MLNLISSYSTRRNFINFLRCSNSHTSSDRETLKRAKENQRTSRKPSRKTGSDPKTKQERCLRFANEKNQPWRVNENAVHLMESPKGEHSTSFRYPIKQLKRNKGNNNTMETELDYTRKTPTELQNREVR